MRPQQKLQRRNLRRSLTFRVKGQNDPQLQRGQEAQNDVQAEHSVQSGVLYVRLMVVLYMVKTVI